MKFLYKAIILLKENRFKTFFFIYVLGVLLSMCLFNNNLFLSLYNSAALFALDIRVEMSPITQWYHYSVYFLALLSGSYTVLSIVELFIKDKMKQDLIKETIKTGKHIIVIGLGESNKVYIDSELRNDDVKLIIVEQNKNNPYIEHYQKSVGVIIADASDKSTLKNLNIENAEHIVISTGSDMTNLEIAIQLLSMGKEIKLFIHIEDRNLRHFHKENGVLSGKNIKVYSYHEEAARELFDVYDIDGNGIEIISSDKPYAITVVGNTFLAYEVIAQACIMGQLPNENQLTIYCVDKNINNFKESIELHFSEIERVPNVRLEYIELNSNTKAFYTDELWNIEMTNIILCLENDQMNLDIASNLTNLSFLDNVVDKDMKTNILVSMFNGYSLSENIKQNCEMFNHLHVFGRISDINDKKYIVAGERDKQAVATDFIYESIGPKLIDYNNYIYNYYAYSDKQYEKTSFIETNDQKWLNHSYFRKESNRAVADQMKMKLKYMGLKIVKSNDNVRSLFDSNKKLFDSYIKDYRIQLAKMEHNRWNTFHYLNGFKAIGFVSKEEKKKMKDIHEAKKVHMCLVKFSEFKNKSDDLLKLGYGKGEFEGYDFMINEHMPLILANAGFIIREML